MIRSFRQSISLLLLASVGSLVACGGSQPSSAPKPAALQMQADPSPAENPFTFRSPDARSEACVTLSLNSEEHSLPLRVKLENHCDHAVAVLTAPLELRIRLTGKEKFVNERMAPGAAYAILYVIAASLGDQALSGDGVARDGGAQVLRPPGYTTVMAKGSVQVPLECGLDVPEGSYFLPMMTYEAPQGEAPIRSDPFDCSVTVERFNLGALKPTRILLGQAVRQLSGRSKLLGEGKGNDAPNQPVQ